MQRIIMQQIIIKITPEDKERLRLAAKKSYQTLSAFIRINALVQADLLLKENKEANTA